MKRLAAYFFQGLVILVPIALTLWLLGAVFTALDDWTRAQLNRFLPETRLPGLGLVAMLLVITGTGFLSSYFLTRPLVTAFERLLDRLPVVKMLHGALRDLMSAFVGPERRFDRPVAVTMPGGLRALGFVTRENTSGLGREDEVAVYFPQAYNFAGQVLLAPRTAVEPLSLPAAEVMTFIVSGGVSGRHRETNRPGETERPPVIPA